MWYRKPSVFSLPGSMARLAAMNVDPMMPVIVGAAFCILVVGLALRRVGQPQVVAYLITGVLLGPHVLEVFTDQVAIARVGDFGVLLLLFFLGMEVCVDELVRGWRVAIIGTALQVFGSVALCFAIGTLMGWPVARIVLLGFVVSLSSTAVVVSVLHAREELHEQVGRDALSVLLVQDVAIAPMLIVVGLLSGGPVDKTTLMLQVSGGAVIIVLVAIVVKKRTIHLPFAKLLEADHELQVFAAGLLCLGLSLATGSMGLSSALGAFVAGLLVGSAPETDWVHHVLEPFRVLLLALFFVSIGLLVDLTFIAEYWKVVGLLVVGTLTTNTLLNGLILKVLGRTWSHSIYTGAVLSQIGELSFVLAAVGKGMGIIDDFAYGLAIATIASTLLLSPAWTGALRAVSRFSRESE